MSGKERLLADLQAAGWARRRRRTRRQGALGGAAVACCLAWAWTVAIVAPPSEPVHHAAPASPAPAVGTTERPQLHDPMLDELAEAGPILITRADGTREIHFTRAVVEHP